jgi:transcription antitermination factor NusG
MKGKMHKLWSKTSGKTHSVASSYKTERKVKEMIGPPRPAPLAVKVPVVLEGDRIVHPRVWTVMHTGPGQELVAVAQLKQFGYGAYCPVITKWTRTGALKRIRHVPLFPRYIFVSVPDDPSRSLNSCSWGKPISTSNNGDMPLFRGHEIYIISDAQAAGVYDEAKSEAERFAALERLKAERLLVREGDRVMINDDLWGEIGATVVHRSPSDRITLLMNILGRATKVTVGLDQIRPAA